MPTYVYGCEECDFEKEIVHSIKEDPEIKCDTCGCIMKRRVVNNGNFILKGSGWSGKDLKEKGFRERRSSKMAQKMANKYDIPLIKPNYKGEVCSSWDDAKKLAKKDGADVTVYDNKVKKLEENQHRIKKKHEEYSKGIVRKTNE